MTQDAWLAAHPYLQPLAEFRARIDAALNETAHASGRVPDWDDYATDFHAGVPLLQSFDAGIDLEPAADVIAALVDRLTEAQLDPALALDVRVLAAEFGDGHGSNGVVDWLLGDDTYTSFAPGLLRCIGWIAAARYLQPVVHAFANWRNEDRWLRRYCPTCGSLPAMAQFVGTEPRRRFLSCGCCATRWRYGRTMCPFCEADTQRLSSLTVENEGGLRIDYCESCRGYLKTYAGEGGESVLLADWTSLHLDLVAVDRGLTREAISLYDLAAAPTG